MIFNFTPGSLNIWIISNLLLFLAVNLMRRELLQNERQRYILAHGEAIEQEIFLKDKAKIILSELCGAHVAEGFQIHSVYPSLAAGGCVDGGEHVEKACFP